MVLRALFLSFCFSMVAASAYCADTGKQFVAQVNGRINVSANGAVTGLSFKNVTSKELHAFLESQIKKWEFHPMTVNGQPVNADAGFNFRLFTSFGNDGKLSNISFQDVVVEPTALELEIQRVNNKNSENLDKRVAPSYPERALRAGAQSSVDVVVKIAPDGSIIQADPYRVALIGVGHKLNSVDIRLLSNQFTQSAVSAVKKWRFAKDTLAAQECLGGCVSLIEVEYTLDGGPWFTYLEVKTPEVSWLANEQITQDISNPKSQLVRFKQQPSSQPIEIGG